MCAPYAGITRVRFDGYVLRLGRADRTTPVDNFDDSAGRTVCNGRRGPNIQHPGETSSERGDPKNPTAVSAWPDGSGRPRSATVVIRRRDGGVIGT
jgi:hypothetical protein